MMFMNCYDKTVIFLIEIFFMRTNPVAYACILTHRPVRILPTALHQDL